MSVPVKTIEQILFELNGHAGPGRWYLHDGLYAVTEPTIINGGIDFTKPKTGIMLKVFINSQNGEAKTFVAKLLAIPEQQTLWGIK